VTLSTEESHYLARVCRARAGDRATATDGRGILASLQIEKVTGGVTAVIESIERIPRRRRASVWCGPPEGDRADWLIEKLGELGVESWRPVRFERGDWKTSATRIARWRRLAIAALRQSRRVHLMEVLEPVDLADALASIPPEAARFVARIDGARPERAGEALTIGVVGPASGLTSGEEEALAGGGFQGIRLSDGRLRTETAALAWAAWWSVG